jgi:hypothetical protein
MKVLVILEQIQIQVAKYSEFWSLFVNRVHPRVPSLTTPPPSPHNRVQNKHIKIILRCRVPYLCTVKIVLKIHWDSRRLDWTRLDATLLVCTHPKCLVKPTDPFSENCMYTHKIEVVRFIESRGKVYPRTSHEGPEGE